MSVALGLDDMGLADDDDMFAEVRLAHVLQRVHGEAAGPAAASRPRPSGSPGTEARRVVGAATAIGRLEPGRRGDVVVLDLRALSAPFAVGEVDVWELLLARARASHVDSVIVEGRVLMLRAHACSTSIATRSWTRSPARPNRRSRGATRRSGPGSTSSGAGSWSTTRRRAGTAPEPVA